MFSETGGFILEIDKQNIETVTSIFSKYGINIFNIGKTSGNSIIINNQIDLLISEGKQAWENGLRDKLR